MGQRGWTPLSSVLAKKSTAVYAPFTDGCANLTGLSATRTNVLDYQFHSSHCGLSHCWYPLAAPGGNNGERYGRRIPPSHPGPLGGDAGADFRVRAPAGRQMSAIYMVGGVVAAALFIYLVAAMLKPEWFE